MYMCVLYLYLILPPSLSLPSPPASLPACLSPSLSCPLSLPSPLPPSLSPPPPPLPPSRDAVEEKLESVESVRDELGEVERIRPGWRKLCCWNDDYLVGRCLLTRATVDWWPDSWSLVTLYQMLSVFLSTCACMCVCLSVCLSNCLSVCLSFCLSVHLCLCTFTCTSLYTNTHLQVDAQTHYGAERLELTQHITDESAAVRSKRLGIGFLSFATERDAQR